MKLPFKHDIRVEPDKQLIISMGNYNGGSGPWVSLKVHTKEAMFIARNLEKALEAGFYVPMDSCVFCGEKFTKTRGTVMLDEEKFAHLKCLRKEHKEASYLEQNSIHAGNMGESTTSSNYYFVFDTLRSGNSEFVESNELVHRLKKINEMFHEEFSFTELGNHSSIL